MNNRTLLGVGFALLGMGTRMMIHIFRFPHENAAFLYLLFLLLATFFAQSLAFRADRNLRTMGLTKMGMQAGSLFAVLVGAFTYIYYAYIDTSFFVYRQAERLESAKGMGYTEEQMESLRKSGEFIFSASVHSTFTLLSFMAVALVYSMIFAMLLKKLPVMTRF